MTENKRLLAVDILRGITIAGMLLVNNPGSWGHLYAPLKHAEWIGLTPTDLVFPFFVFVMGVAMYFSLRKYYFKPSRQLVFKIVRRTVVLFLIGWAVQWFGMWLRGFYNPDAHFWTDMFGKLRILGVFQRLALVYFFGSIIAITFKQKLIPWLIALILIVYAFILGFNDGYEFSLNNILSRIDIAWLGEEHMYHETAFGERLALDPEGILSTLPCIAHVLIGFMVGKCLTSIHDNRERIAVGLERKDVGLVDRRRGQPLQRLGIRVLTLKVDGVEPKHAAHRLQELALLDAAELHRRLGKPHPGACRALRGDARYGLVGIDSGGAENRRGK